MSLDHAAWWGDTQGTKKFKKNKKIILFNKLVSRINLWIFCNIGIYDYRDNTDMHHYDYHLEKYRGISWVPVTVTTLVTGIH